MAIVGWEWIVVVAIVAIILIWGPGQIPKLAKSLGQAKKEMKDTLAESEENNSETNEPDETDETTTSNDKNKVKVDPLIVTAIKLGIDVTGKTREQISDEIVAKTKKE